jgi:predicted metal-dependent phosphoesterase TrpH
LEPVFVTDHDTTLAAVHLQVVSRQRVVVGEEITTTDGELIGLFLQRQIPAGLTARQTALEIKDQAGLVYLEHPYDQFRRHLSEEAIEDLADLIDIVEVFNARSDEKTNRRAEELREILGAAPGAGSDAHRLTELGSVYVEMENFDGAQDFLANLRRARVVRRRPKLLLMAEAQLGHKILRP